MSETDVMAADALRLQVASDWLLRMEADSLSGEELAQWLQWYDSDADNRAAFEKLQATFEAIRTEPAESKLVLAHQLMRRPEHATTWSSQRQRSGSAFVSWMRGHRAYFAAAATALAFAIGIGTWRIETMSAIQIAAFETERAAHREIELPDGSRVRLGARSQLFTNFTPPTRYLVLEGGEAFFEVAKDASRPFLVQAGPVTVRAVGTEFNIRRVMDQTIVTVTEGVVDVIRNEATSTSFAVDAVDLRLTKDEQVTVASSSSVPSVKHVIAASATGWQQGRLEFVDEPLRVVIATVNRYSQREVIIDNDVQDLRFTGTVNGDRIDEWLRALPDIFPVSVERAGKDAVLISQRTAS